MMERVKFDPSEVNTAETWPPNAPGRPCPPKFRTPITPKENFQMMFKGERPFWIPIDRDIQQFRPRLLPDNLVCGLVWDGGKPLSTDDFSGKGWFDTEWTYVPSANGAMTKPGNPQLVNIEDWEKIAIFPDLDALDWESSAKENEENYFTRERPVEICVLCGFFERLMAFMDTENAAIALIDEDQKPYVHQLFDRLCNFYDQLIDKIHTYYHVDIVLLHDDWGTQRAPFFSANTHREMILPYIKRVVESCHKRGMLYEQHSCGKIECMAPNMIEAGVDIWCGQNVNDFEYLAEHYSQDMVIGVSPVMDMNASDEEIRTAAKAFVEKYQNKRIIAVTFLCPPAFTKYVYEYGRQACSD